jgi:hypothetical protein
MAGSIRGSLALVLGLMLSSPAAAQAIYYDCVWPVYYPAWTVAYWPVCYAYAPATKPAPRATPAPAARQPMPAAKKESTQPKEKEPARTVEPEATKPLPATTSDEKRPPIVTESRSGRVEAVSGDKCRVGFWNLSGHDVSLTVEGKTHALAKDRAVTLDLPREFAWRVGESAERTEQIPAGRSSHEVVIRE